MTLSILNAISTYPAVETLFMPTILALLPLSSLFVQGNQNDNAVQQPRHDEQLHIMSHPDVARDVKSVCENGGLDGTKNERRSANRRERGLVC